MRLKFVAAALVLAPLVSACETLLNPVYYVEQVNDQIDAMQGVYVGQGWRVDDRPRHVGNLRNGARDDLVVNLTEGVQYAFIGACDADCGDLDLSLYDPRGALLAQDILPDAVPVVTYVATESGPHSLAASMARCLASSCYYGIAFLEQ